jgi:DNA invertase Pin-like site-specific DNA recombinase
MKDLNIKPNFNEIAREFGVDRHTLSKYWNDGKRKPIKRDKKSYLADYLDEIKEKTLEVNCSRMGFVKKKL